MDSVITSTNIITKLVAIYARVSTGRQENEETIKNQLMVLHELAKKNGWSIVGEYVDDGWSGDILTRPNLDRLREDANKKMWEAIVIYDPDRLARRYSYQELVMDELIEQGIEVIFTTIPAPKNHEEKIMHGIRGLFAEYERAKIAERFRLGKKRKAEDGHLLLSSPKYGYNYIPKKDKVHGYYEINKKEAEIVKLIFRWIDEERLSIRGVAKKLLEMKIPPRKNKRGVWNTSTLCTLLRDKTYIGEAHYLKSYAVVPEKPLKNVVYKKHKKTSRKLRPEEEWIKIPVPAIIDKNLFERVQNRLKENFELCKRNKKNQYLLAGKIYCPCGQRRAGEGPQHGKHLYYRCINRVSNYPLPRNCYEKGLNARIADELVWNKLSELMTSPNLIMDQAEKWSNQQNETSNNFQIPTAEFKKEIEKLKKEEDRYVKAYGAGVIEIDELKQHRNDLRGKISNLEGQIASFEQQERNNSVKIVNLPTKDELNDFCQSIKEMIKCVSFEAKRKIVLEVVEKVTGNQQELLVEGYLPVGSTNHVSLCSIHRHRRFA